MGIDYYSCNYCGYSFPDVIDYISCKCGNVWDCEGCADEDGYKLEYCKLHPELDNSDLMEEYRCKHPSCFELNDYCGKCDNYAASSCKYCREEDFDDLILLNFILEDYNITREELIEKYKNKDKKKCKDCDSCSFGFFKSKPEKFVCLGVKNPFVIHDVNNKCTEY